MPLSFHTSKPVAQKSDCRHYARCLAASFSPIYILLIILVAAASACKASSRNRGNIPNTSSGEKIVYQDGIGRRVEIPRHPRRIISLAPDVTETLYLLGAQDRLIGNTTQCHWPEEAKSKPKIGDLLNPNYEVILAAHPDLVISSTAGNDQAAVMKLVDLGLPVYVTAPRSVAKIFQSVLEIGRITDCEERAHQLVEEMKARLEKVRKQIENQPRVKAFFVTWFDPLLAPGKATFENDVLALAGVESITADIPQYYPRYSLEQLLLKDPDAIITVKQEGNPLPDLKKMAGWNKLRAVRQGKVFVVTEFLQHPSPLFVEGVEELAAKLYPERFQ